MTSRGRSERGAAAVEFAIVSLLFVTLLYGILMYGFIFAIDQNITHASAEGARSAISQPTAELQVLQARTVAWRRLPSWIRDRMEFDTDVTAEIVTGADCDSTDASVTCVRVRILYPWQDEPVVPPVLNIGVPDTITAVAIVQLD